MSILLNLACTFILLKQRCVLGISSSAVLWRLHGRRFYYLQMSQFSPIVNVRCITAINIEDQMADKTIKYGGSLLYWLLRVHPIEGWFVPILDNLTFQFESSSNKTWIRSPKIGNKVDGLGDFKLFQSTLDRMLLNFSKSQFHNLWTIAKFFYCAQLNSICNCHNKISKSANNI